MNIVLVGLGEVGRYVAETLANQHHNLSLIEASEALAQELDERLDALVIHGNATSVLQL